MEIASGREAPRHHMVDPLVHTEVSARSEEERNDERECKKKEKDRRFEAEPVRLWFE